MPDEIAALLSINPGLGHTWREARYELPYALVVASARLGAPAHPPGAGRGRISARAPLTVSAEGAALGLRRARPP